MARTGRPRKPQTDWFLTLRGASSPERQAEWARHLAALAEVLQRSARGEAARILAREAGVSVESSVQHFLAPRSEDLYWSLRLAGNWGLVRGDKVALIGEIRKKLIELAEAHENLALKMCDRSVCFNGNTNAQRAAICDEFRLLGFFDDEIEHFLSEPGTSVNRLNRSASDIRGWMYAFLANGRGSVASIVVAELIAAFFDTARIVADKTNDAQTAKSLRVKFARTGTIPANSYCLAVESALIALEMRGSPKSTPGGGWHRAAEDVCTNREKLTDKTGGETSPQ